MGLNLKKKFKRGAKWVKKKAKQVAKLHVDVATGGQADKLQETYEDLTGKTAADEMKRQTQAQQEQIDKQEKVIADKQAVEDKVTEERKRRMSQNLLLSGAETGGRGRGNSLLSARG